jgi:RNA polymerase sigma factor (sigma-70 family)
VGISPDAHLPGSKAEDAFEEFVRGRSTHLFRLALVLTGWDRAAAEDVLQIALERAYRRRRLLFREGSAEPYVRRVVVNAAIDWRRMLRRRAEQPLDLAAGLAAGDRTGLVADRDVLVRALAALAPKQRAVLVLRYWDRRPGRRDSRHAELQPGDGAEPGIARLDPAPRAEPRSLGRAIGLARNG